MRWRKSSHSGGTAQDECVEVCDNVPGYPGVVAIRHSKVPQAGFFTVSRASFGALTRHLARRK